MENYYYYYYYYIYIYIHILRKIHKGHVVQFFLYFFISIESVPLVYWSNFSCHYINWWLSYSARARFTPENYISLFLLYFFKAYLLFLQGTEANKHNATCNLHRLTKIQFQFYIEEETSPQPFFSYPEVRSRHVQNGLTAYKTAKKSVEVIKIGPCGKRWWEGGERVSKRLQKKLQKGDKVAMIISLTTDNSWPSFKNYKQCDPPSDFVSFCTFLTK